MQVLAMRPLVRTSRRRLRISTLATERVVSGLKQPCGTFPRVARLRPGTALPRGRPILPESPSLFNYYGPDESRRDTAGLVTGRHGPIKGQVPLLPFLSSIASRGHRIPGRVSRAREKLRRPATHPRRLLAEVCLSSDEPERGSPLDFSLTKT